MKRLLGIVIIISSLAVIVACDNKNEVTKYTSQELKQLEQLMNKYCGIMPDVLYHKRKIDSYEGQMEELDALEKKEINSKRWTDLGDLQMHHFNKVIEALDSLAIIETQLNKYEPTVVKLPCKPLEDYMYLFER